MPWLVFRPGKSYSSNWTPRLLSLATLATISFTNKAIWVCCPARVRHWGTEETHWCRFLHKRGHPRTRVLVSVPASPHRTPSRARDPPPAASSSRSRHSSSSEDGRAKFYSQLMAQETLFPVSDQPVAKDQPLAARIRPRTLDEFVGQEHLVGPEHELRRAIEEGRVGW